MLSRAGSVRCLDDGPGILTRRALDPDAGLPRSYASRQISVMPAVRLLEQSVSAPGRSINGRAALGSILFYICSRSATEENMGRLKEWELAEDPTEQAFPALSRDSGAGPAGIGQPVPPHVANALRGTRLNALFRSIGRDCIRFMAARHRAACPARRGRRATQPSAFRRRARPLLACGPADRRSDRRPGSRNPDPGLDRPAPGIGRGAGAGPGRCPRRGALL
jgi:hypothetical protein